MALITNLCIFISFCPLVQSYEAEKNQVGMITFYSTFVFFVFSLATFVVSLLSFLKNRRLHQFRLTEPRTHIYYQNKGKTPKLKRRVLEVMDKGGSILKKPNAKTKKSNSYSSLNAPPSE